MKRMQELWAMLKWQWKHCKCPLVSRRYHEQVLNNTGAWHGRLVTNLRAELDKERQELRELIGKMVHVKFETAGRGNYLGHRYRVCVDIDPGMVRDCFVHGGDQHLIGHLCQELGFFVAQEIKTLNFSRLAHEAVKEERRPAHPFIP